MATTTTVAVIPGTGNIGYGVAWRFARAGFKILLASRDVAKAEEAVKKILKDHPNAQVKAYKNEDLPVDQADVVVWCPQSSIAGAKEYLKQFKLDGKIVLDTTNINYKVKDPSQVLGKTSATELVRWNDLRDLISSEQGRLSQRQMGRWNQDVPRWRVAEGQWRAQGPPPQR